MAEIKKVIKFRKNIKRGLAPGTLIFTGQKRAEKPEITLYDFTREHQTEKKLTNIAEASDFANTNTITWINIDGIHDVDLVKSLGEYFKIHPLVLEDILNPNQRPKVEYYPEYTYVVLKMANWTADGKKMEFEQLSVIFSGKFIITLQERPGDAFDEVRDRMRNPSSRMRNSGIDFLFGVRG